MDKSLIKSLTTDFEAHATDVDGVECWFARDLQLLLGYTQWRNFIPVIEKAKISCQNAGNAVEDHFADVRKMVEIGSKATRKVNDVLLTRYACYLIAQNGDPRKDEIAFAQTYFALQTRKQELIEERLAYLERIEQRRKLTASETELSKNIFERGVDNAGFGRIRSKGDAALFGGETTRNMKYKLGVPHRRPLADFLPAVTIAAKNLATEITNFNVKKEDLHGEISITVEHVKSNRTVRRALGDSGITPEDLPPEEDIKKIERRIKSADTKSLKKAGTLKKGSSKTK